MIMRPLKNRLEGCRMTEIGNERNANWTRDELILALNLYQRHQGNPPGKSSKEVMELSKLLNSMGSQFSNGKADFRNPNGVYMKVMNFRRFDPFYLAQGKKGLERGGKLEADVWNDFADKPHILSDTANAIRAMVEKGSPGETGIEAGDENFEAGEGRVLTRVHLARERNRKLVEQKKLTTLKKTGKLACEVCSFDFKSSYGERGAGFIEAHHLKPVHTLLPGQKTKLEELSLLCSNCHRMIHARRPWLSVEQLKQQLRS
jgi:5-methylcytosine-specific restriction protein A